MNFFHQGNDILIYSIDVAMDMTKLKTNNNIQILTHCIVTVLTKLTG